MGSRLQEGRRVKRKGADDRIEIDLRSANSTKSVLSLLKRKFKGEAEEEMPTQIEPMMATLIKEPFDDENWEFEIKWDGYRCVAFVGDRKVDLRSRTGLSYNKYTPIVTALSKWNIPAVLDGELVVLNENGTSNFELLQNWNIHSEERIAFIVFDILWLDGINLLEQPLTERKGILQKILPESNIIRFAPALKEMERAFLSWRGRMVSKELSGKGRIVFTRLEGGQRTG